MESVKNTRSRTGSSRAMFCNATRYASFRFAWKSGLKSLYSISMTANLAQRKLDKIFDFLLPVYVHPRNFTPPWLNMNRIPCCKTHMYKKKKSVSIPCALFNFMSTRMSGPSKSCTHNFALNLSLYFNSAEKGKKFLKRSYLFTHRVCTWFHY